MRIEYGIIVYSLQMKNYVITHRSIKLVICSRRSIECHPFSTFK